MKLAYLTTCFSTPSHTFIRRELRRFEALGVSVELYGIHRDTNPSADGVDLAERTHYLYPLRLLSLAGLNLYFALLHPRRYWSCFWDCLNAEGESWKSRLTLLYHFKASAGFAKDMMDRRITHLHAHFLNVSSSVAMFSSRLSGIPYSITIHSAGEKNLPHVIGIAMKLRWAKYLLMISRYNIDYYDAIYPCREKSIVVRCGMNIEDFEFRAPPHTEPEMLKVLAVGRFVEKKGFQYLIEAANILLRRGQYCSIKILGSGPLEEQFKLRVSELKIDDMVSLPGKVSSAEVKQRMATSDVVVVPSVTSASGEMEGIPVVIMEAMALGVPVIASAHSGIPELVSEETGTLVPEKDAQALADAIHDFHIDIDKLRRARALIENEFNIETVVEQRLNIFSQS